jgi:hypothetical protein
MSGKRRELIAHRVGQSEDSPEMVCLTNTGDYASRIHWSQALHPWREALLFPNSPVRQRNQQKKREEGRDRVLQALDKKRARGDPHKSDDAQPCRIALGMRRGKLSGRVPVSLKDVVYEVLGSRTGKSFVFTERERMSINQRTVTYQREKRT